MGADEHRELDLIDALVALDECDGHVVLVIDPQTAEIDAQGPYHGPEAAVVADALRTSLDAEDLDDVIVSIVWLHLPARSASTDHAVAPSAPHLS